jgi:hypothetical protein
MPPMPFLVERGKVRIREIKEFYAVYKLSKYC